ncbi:Uncharacterised protein [Mycobacterium tuberculosis]|nr:Uncharacterised protein [Mycobacterium tuberculosis]
MYTNNATRLMPDSTVAAWSSVCGARPKLFCSFWPKALRDDAMAMNTSSANLNST